MSLEKSKLRIRMKSCLNDYNKEDLDAKSAKIVLNIRSLLNSLNLYPKNLGLYYPVQGEVNCLSLKNIGKPSFPSFIQDSNEMCFKACLVDELETIEAFGKTFNVPPNVSDIVEPEVLLVPGLAFSKTGKRLGKGKGYYDRYLSNINCLKIGICFNEQLLEDVEIPFDGHDQRMDFIASETQIIKVE